MSCVPEDPRRMARRLRLLRFLVFPGGLPGVGLLLLRLALGTVTVLEGVAYLEGDGRLSTAASGLGAFAIACGVMLLLGFLTPLVGTLTGLGIVAAVISLLPSFPHSVLDGTLALLFAGFVSAAIVLLGPGAFSIDARLFGRREIIIPRMSHPPE